jgi:hypothetical protein
LSKIGDFIFGDFNTNYIPTTINEQKLITTNGHQQIVGRQIISRQIVGRQIISRQIIS